jgi:ankyrin repeat protein
VQLLLTDVYEARKHMHEPYKGFRADDVDKLHADFLAATVKAGRKKLLARDGDSALMVTCRDCDAEEATQLLQEASLAALVLVLDEVAVGDTVLVHRGGFGQRWLEANVTEVHVDSDGDRTWDVRFVDDDSEEAGVTPNCMLSLAEGERDRTFVVACRYGCEGVVARPEFTGSAARMWRQAWVAAATLGPEMSPGVVEALLAAGAKDRGGGLDAHVRSGETALLLASQFGHLRAVEQLLARGANVDETGAAGQTPLWWAAKHGQTDCAKLLLAAGASPTTMGGAAGSMSALYCSAEFGHAPMCELLATAGADVDQADKEEGRTPLFQCASRGWLDCVAQLIAAGADINKARTSDGSTPVAFASQEGFVDVVQALIAAGADVNKARFKNDEYGDTPLYEATRRGQSAVIAVLLAAGATTKRDLAEARRTCACAKRQ